MVDFGVRTGVKKVLLCMAHMIMDIAGKALSIKHVLGPTGVRGRNSDNRLIQEELGWKPSQPLRKGLETTYAWIAEQVERARGRNIRP